MKLYIEKHPDGESDWDNTIWFEDQYYPWRMSIRDGYSRTDDSSLVCKIYSNGWEHYVSPPCEPCHTPGYLDAIKELMKSECGASEDVYYLWEYSGYHNFVPECTEKFVSNYEDDE